MYEKDTFKKKLQDLKYTQDELPFTSQINNQRVKMQERKSSFI